MRRLLPLLTGAAAVAVLLVPLGAASPATPAALQPTSPVLAATVTPAERGYDRLTVRRASSWYLRPDLAGGPARTFAEGSSGWRPVAGDTDGNGSDSLSLFRDGIWQIRDSEGGPVRTIRFGRAGDRPFLGDWNGDGVDSVGVFRAGTWFLRDNSAAGPTRSFRFGLSSDRPVVGDWNGDRRTDIAVVRGRTWYQRDAASAGSTSRTFTFGQSGDTPVSGDWNHDGRDTAGLWRAGTWFLRRDNTSTSPYATAVFGQAGDQPVIRRTRGLAPGVTHRVVRRDGAVVQVLTIDLAAASSVDAVLSNGTLKGTERTSTMARRAGAVAAVNGDFALSDGRPVHAFSRDGALLQTAQVRGRAMGMDLSGTKVPMGFPDARATLAVSTAGGNSYLGVSRWNSGRATSRSLAAFTAAGAGLPGLPDGDCYAALAPASSPFVRGDGAVEQTLTVTWRRCGGARPAVPSTGVLLDGVPAQPSGSYLSRLRVGQSVRLVERTGFEGSTDVTGGNPLLVHGGSIPAADVDGTDAFSRANPRTAVGRTADGRLLMVVVDGREYGYSAGMSLRQLADFMLALGAVEAINLDGGGSSTMWLNGLVVNRPSDGSERPVTTALVVLRGADPGEAVLRPAAPAPAPTAQVAQPAASTDGTAAAAQDPASTGGLAARLADTGVPLSPDLRRAEQRFRATRGRQG